MLKQYQPVLTVLLASLAFYVINKLLFLLPDLEAKYASFHYSIEILYLFFTVCSVAIVAMVIKVHEHLPDSTGYAFISGTTVKMGICYFMMRPILKTATENNSTEKFNFFILFILFLAIETVVTIRLLNKKQ